MRDENQLHAAVVELIAMTDARTVRMPMTYQMGVPIKMTAT